MHIYGGVRIFPDIEANVFAKLKDLSLSVTYGKMIDL